LDRTPLRSLPRYAGRPGSICTVTSPPPRDEAPACTAARQIAESAVYTSVPQIAPLDAQPGGQRTCAVLPIARWSCVAL